MYKKKEIRGRKKEGEVKERKRMKDKEEGKTQKLLREKGRRIEGLGKGRKEKEFGGMKTTHWRGERKKRGREWV